MPRESRPWFRLYGEMLHDRKLAHVARMIGQPRALILGAWASILCLASGSPQRGALLVADGTPYQPDDLAQEIGLDPDLACALVAAFVTLDMLTLTGYTYVVTHWSDRQYESDLSTERSRRSRERSNQATLLQRPSAARATPPQSDPDTESDPDPDPDTDQSVVVSQTTDRTANTGPEMETVYLASDDLIYLIEKAVTDWDPTAEMEPAIQRAFDLWAQARISESSMLAVTRRALAVTRKRISDNQLNTTHTLRYFFTTLENALQRKPRPKARTPPG